MATITGFLGDDDPLRFVRQQLEMYKKMQKAMQPALPPQVLRPSAVVANLERLTTQMEQMRGGILSVAVSSHLASPLAMVASSSVATWPQLSTLPRWQDQQRALLSGLELLERIQSPTLPPPVLADARSLLEALDEPTVAGLADPEEPTSDEVDQAEELVAELTPAVAELAPDQARTAVKYLAMALGFALYIQAFLASPELVLLLGVVGIEALDVARKAGAAALKAWDKLHPPASNDQ
ncbi:hypothetical protein [Yinghuangia sp. YIM S09857]|uniref:hypothetical protein n=1 Tax=Yinghuangia sp. YIM S09857 TaxID=3436929 RepID=UPI003F52EC62